MLLEPIGVQVVWKQEDNMLLEPLNVPVVWKQEDNMLFETLDVWVVGNKRLTCCMIHWVCGYLETRG